MKNWIFTTILCAVFASVLAQTKTTYTADDYIRMYHEAAVNNMVQHKVPASITLAQGLFESGYGNSPLAVNANNHFGIKCHEWTGDKYYHDDDAPQECFRKYASAAESYADHALFLKTRKRYVKCFDLDVCDYKGWATELKAAGYATLPTYPEKIIGIIERYKLYEYDQQALAIMGIKPKENIIDEPKPEVVKTEEKQIPEKKTDDLPKEKITEKVVIQEPVIVEKKTPTRDISENNGVQFIIAKKGDTQASIAAEFDLAEWQIRRYNDLDVNEALVAGMHIYIAPKKDKSDDIDTHVVSEGENLEQIAQMHAIKKSALMELNGLSSELVLAGQTLKLR